MMPGPIIAIPPIMRTDAIGGNDEKELNIGSDAAFHDGLLCKFLEISNSMFF